jgi:hypothetical protein
MTNIEIEPPPDELILQHLGAAIMLCWTKLPLSARDTILDQAGDIIGLAPVTAVRSQIIDLLARRTKA